MELDSKIYIAGHMGLVGSAIHRKLREKGYTSTIGRPRKELDLERQAQVESFFEEERPAVCLRCDVPYQALIITPTLLKDYANGLLLQVWRKAEERITRADRLVFIGYSLADADVQIKCMIKRATYNGRIQRPERPTITVVDKKGKGTQAKERYRRLFGEVEYLPIGFVQYVQRHIR